MRSFLREHTGIFLKEVSELPNVSDARNLADVARGVSTALTTKARAYVERIQNCKVLGCLVVEIPDGNVEQSAHAYMRYFHEHRDVHLSRSGRDILQHLVTTAILAEVADLLFFGQQEQYIAA